LEKARRKGYTADRVEQLKGYHGVATPIRNRIVRLIVLPGLWAVTAAAGSAGEAGVQGQPPAFDGAKWVWYSREPMPIAQNFPAGVSYFRGALALPEKAQIASAELILTADNLFTLHLNGQLAGEGHPEPDNWNQPKRFDVTRMLVPGRNVVAVEAVNTAQGWAGVLVKLVADLADGQRAVLVSDGAWQCTDKEDTGWQQPGFDDRPWRAAHVVGDYGMAPWGRVAVTAAVERAGAPPDEARKRVRRVLDEHKVAARQGGGPAVGVVLEATPPADYPWPEALVFVGEDCSLYRSPAHTGTGMDSLTVTIFNPRNSRAFPEHDLPAPMKVGRKLYALAPARPGAKPRLLLDAGKGGIGSPSVSFDGRWIYLSMARDGEPFFHIYRLPAEGGEPRRLTDGPFHDIDPAELPDGRVVFTSTRIGTFEEYHNPPSRALFVMNADGRDVHAVTHTLVFDNEPEVLADGRILFIRTDNFFDRGKVETLLHAVHPDGTEGYTEFGLDLGPEYGGRLRAFNCGSPAPLPDGGVAFATGSSIAVGRLGSPQAAWRNLRVEAGDVAALPDGRLLCTLPQRVSVEITEKKGKRTVQDIRYMKIGIVDPERQDHQVAVVFESPDAPLHSPVYLGARPRPPVLPEKVNRLKADEPRPTGVLFCQNARFTKNTTAGWTHVRAIRVLGGKGLTLRSSHSYIVHAGSEVVELGTVPLSPDGSFAVEVPADMGIAFQAVDGEGRSELNEMSWIYVRPGENRGCVGCHQPRQLAPAFGGATAEALRARPLRLLGQGQPHRFRGNNAAVTGMMEMQFDRFREVAGLNRHSEAVEPLATGAGEVAALIEQLKGRDEGLRLSAAQRLAVFRHRAAAPALAERLGDESREARAAAALALSACGTRESVPPLLGALKDKDPVVAQAAAVALENLTGHAEGFNAFAPREERNAQVEKWQAWFRGNAWEAVEQDLVQRLERPDRDAVRRAAVALGHMGGDAGRAALRSYVARERTNNPLPAWRKNHSGDGAMFNSLSPVNPRALQAATRSLGYLQDQEAVALLAETLNQHSDPGTGNLFLAEAAVEALGRIGTPEAQTALTAAFARLKDYPGYTRWYGDHDALMACHASPVHYFIIEALDALGSAQAGGIVPHLIRSVPTDPDRALFAPNDDYEALTGRVIRRARAEAAVVETCLALLGDPQATRAKDIEQALSAVHGAWGGKPDPQNRAAQILSLTCRDREYEPRIRAAFDRYREKDVAIPRVFDTGIPVVNALPAKHWVCFFLARALGNLACPQSADALLAALAQSPPEAASGHPDPLGPGVLFLHNDLTPCWRAAVAWALGRIGDRRATGVLLKVIGNLDNATDTRHAAAEALERLADPASMEAIRKLAADYPEVSTRKALLRACANPAR
jgi:HEAT repeat protein